MNGKRVGAVLAAAFLMASASSFAVEPTHLARRIIDYLVAERGPTGK
ncbi:MAG TPA: hypothetical protein VJ386_02230 [Candidatus Deferrimicrobiaceae bacterium]|nr:hypothetical protein [Candidatus Deferrimicrobiaceae bacterium]